VDLHQHLPSPTAQPRWRTTRGRRREPWEGKKCEKGLDGELGTEVAGLLAACPTLPSIHRAGHGGGDGHGEAHRWMEQGRKQEREGSDRRRGGAWGSLALPPTRKGREAWRAAGRWWAGSAGRGGGASQGSRRASGRRKATCLTFFYEGVWGGVYEVAVGNYLPLHWLSKFVEQLSRSLKKT
jgi:hypothetical protein